MFWTSKKITKTHLIPNDDLLKIYKINVSSLNSIKIVSFYNSNIDKKIVDYQRKVFDWFNIPIEQIYSEVSHAEFLLSILSAKDGFEYVLFFDVDCIVLKKEAIFAILADISDQNTIAGAIQTANHKQNGKNNYVGPFFLGISKKLFNRLSIETLMEDEIHDIGGILTMKTIEIGSNVKYWYPTDVEMPCWNLYPESTFGYGTTYNGLVYHAFEIRFNSRTRFIKKCKRVLKGLL